MTLTEKIELIQGSSSKEILNRGAHNGTPLLKYVYEVHEEVFGMPCKTCSSLIPKYISKIQNINLNQPIMSNSERQYRMKPNSVIHVHGTRNYYSDFNITDEIARKLIEVNPNRKVLFSKLPIDPAPVKEIEVNEAVVVKNDDEGLKLSELREKYPHIKARSKKEFLRELNA